MGAHLPHFSLLIWNLLILYFHRNISKIWELVLCDLFYMFNFFLLTKLPLPVQILEQRVVSRAVLVFLLTRQHTCVALFILVRVVLFYVPYLPVAFSYFLRLRIPSWGIYYYYYYCFAIPKSSDFKGNSFYEPFPCLFCHWLFNASRNVFSLLLPVVIYLLNNPTPRKLTTSRFPNLFLYIDRNIFAFISWLFCILLAFLYHWSVLSCFLD